MPPPERYLPQHRWTPATDIYGLAATLYALLTGQVPTPSTQRERTPLREPRQFQPQISFAVEQAILKGMALTAKDRPQSIDDWLALLPRTAQRVTPSSATVPPKTAALPTFSQPGVSLPDASNEAAAAPDVSSSENPQQMASSSTSADQSSPPGPRFPKRLLLGGGAIAAMVGFGLGLVLRFQSQHLFAPAQIPTNGKLRLKNEPFLPKSTPAVINSDSAEPAPTLPQPQPEQPPSEGDLSQPDLPPPTVDTQEVERPVPSVPAFGPPVLNLGDPPPDATVEEPDPLSVPPADLDGESVDPDSPFVPLPGPLQPFEQEENQDDTATDRSRPFVEHSLVSPPAS